MRRLAASVAVSLLFSSQAYAGGAGAGIAQTGGAGGGASADAAHGLSGNPAAAVGARGTELHGDLGFMILQASYARMPRTGPGADPNDPADDVTHRKGETFGMSSVPYFAVRSDRPFAAKSEDSKLGIGFSLSVPFGRSVRYNDEHGGRYHLNYVKYSTIYLAPVLAVRPIPSVRIGAGPVLGYSQFSVTQRVDLAPSLILMSPGDPAPPAESGLLEGEVDVRGAKSFTPHFTGGVMVDVGEKATVGASFISGARAAMKGKSELTPSLDFNVQSTGDFTLRQNLPPMVNVGGRIAPNETMSFSLEGQWVGWSVNRQYDITIENSRISSGDEDTQALLTALDINEGQLVENILDKEQVTARGWKDSINVTAGAELARGPMRWRLDLGYDQSAIPDRNVSAGNLDYSYFVAGVSGRWTPRKGNWAVGGSLAQFISPVRTVSESESRYDTYQPYGSGFAYPSGAGTYSATLTRVAVNTTFRF